MSESQVQKQLAELKSGLLAEGKAMRRKLVGDAYADKLDREVYQNKHMEKFGDLTQEIVFAQMWTRPGLDLKMRSMITVISDVTSGSMAALSLHVRFCRIHGWLRTRSSKPCCTASATSASRWCGRLCWWPPRCSTS